MKEFKILSASGQLGYGFPPEILYEGAKQKPNLIAADAGSNDGGPYYLGSGKGHCDENNIKRDLSYILPVVRDSRVPFIVGSCGTAGGVPHVHKTLQIIKDVLQEMDWHPKIAVIHAEISKDIIREKLANNQVRAIDGAPELTEKDLDESARIVGQMGIEPFLRALETGVDIILAGRACDTAVFAAMPIKAGFDPGLCFHAAKIIECGAYCCTPGGGSEAMLATIREKDFILEALNPKRKCLPTSVAAHTLYEQGHPSRFYEPDGMTDCSTAKFETFEGNEQKVRVHGTTFVPAKEGQYSLKVEGAARQGYRCISLAGIRDCFMIKHLDEAIKNVNNYVVTSAGAPEKSGYKINYRVYGKNAIMGELEYETATPYEVGVLIDVLANTQAHADKICALVRSNLLHCEYPERRTTGGNVAMAFSPHDIPVGPVYRFSIYHVLEGLSNADFKNMFKIEIVEV